MKEADVLDEWYDFFLKRMEELHQEEIKAKIEHFRKEFSFPKKLAESIDLKEIERMIDEPPFIPNANKRARNDSAGPLNSNNQGQAQKKSRFSERSGSSQQNVVQTLQKFAQNSQGYQQNPQRNQQNPQRNQQNPQRFPRHSNQPRNNPTSNYFGQPVKLISTLRILSTLESELGLLAHKILDLLSIALATERDQVNSSDDLLFNPEHFNTIEMSKEKLLGIQAANLVQPFKMQAVQKAIDDTTRLLEQHDNFQKALSRSHKGPPPGAMRGKAPNQGGKMMGVPPPNRSSHVPQLAPPSGLDAMMKMFSRQESDQQGSRGWGSNNQMRPSGSNMMGNMQNF